MRILVYSRLSNRKDVLMTETSHSTEATTAEVEPENTPTADPAAVAAEASSGDGPSAAADRRVRYCPTCHARYLKAADECVSCAVALVDEQPRDFALFRPELDLPFVVLLALYIWGYSRLNGEAQSFGLIFLIVGFATLVTFRAISYVEWLGRR